MRRARANDQAPIVRDDHDLIGPEWASPKATRLKNDLTVKQPWLFNRPIGRRFLRKALPSSSRKAVGQEN